MSGLTILTPLTVRKTTFRNRILMPSMVTNYGAVNAEVTDRLIAYHVARARGGLGLNMLEATSVHDSSLCYAPGVAIAHDSQIKGLKKLADAVHAAGGKMGVQLNHAGRAARPAMSHQPRLLVSYVPGYTIAENSRVMDAEDIQTQINAFVAAARRAVEAGFDIVEIHGAHGYLISQFLSPAMNMREDAYGGSFDNRLRFAEEVCRGVRKAVGDDFPISFRCSAAELVPDGLDLAASVNIAKRVVACGVDLIHVSAGILENNWFIGPTPNLPKAWNGERALAIKQALAGTGAKVAVAGRIIDRESAEAMVASGMADMVAMGRASIADPDLVNKIAEGREADIIPCIGCSEGCGRTPAPGEDPGIWCALNPWTGFEMKRAAQKTAAQQKHVVVIGGGPAGMQAAISAAEKGHSVSLYEKEARLGGLVNMAALPPHKDILNLITDFYRQTMNKMGVKVHLGTAPSVEEIKSMGADVVFVATGSIPAVPAFMEKAPTVSAQEVLAGAKTGKRVLVLGGGMVGSETAELLARQGKKVTILEMQNAIAVDMYYRHRHFLLENLKELQVEIMTCTEVTHISATGMVTVRDRYGRIFDLPQFDTLVTALGYRSDNSLAAQLFAAGVDFTALGDCVRPGKIMGAIHQAHEAASKI